MSRNINVNPAHYKVRGRERQGEDVLHEMQRQQFSQQSADARWHSQQHELLAPPHPPEQIAAEQADAEPAPTSEPRPSTGKRGARTTSPRKGATRRAAARRKPARTPATRKAASRAGQRKETGKARRARPTGKTRSRRRTRPARDR
jgi:hypothetical protein